CRAPVAAIQRVRRAEEHRTGDECAAPQRCLDEQRRTEVAGGMREECAREVRLATMAEECVPVQGMDGVELPFIEAPADPGLEADAGFRDAAALAFHLLALRGGEA